MAMKINITDPDILGSLPALRWAARRARELAVRTGTPCYIMPGGRIINIAAGTRPENRRKPSPKPRRKRSGAAR
jgi:hypothetical protein